MQYYYCITNVICFS